METIKGDSGFSNIESTIEKFHQSKKEHQENQFKILMQRLDKIVQQLNIIISKFDEKQDANQTK